VEISFIFSEKSGLGDITHLYRRNRDTDIIQVMNYRRIRMYSCYTTQDTRSKEIKQNSYSIVLIAFMNARLVEIRPDFYGLCHMAIGADGVR
jgi:hypothetical protein